MKRSLKIKTAICGVICLSAGSVYAGTYAVPSQYATIQAAITAASSNSVINVAPGTYNERLSFGTKMMLTINGTGGAAATIIDGGSTGPILAVGPMSMAGMPITMNGFTFQNGYSSINGGVANLAATSELVILNSVVANNQGGTGGAFSVKGGNLKIRNSVISGNTAINTGSAIYVATGKVYLVNDTITGNTSADGSAINQQYGATVSGINDIVYGNLKVDGTVGAPIFNGPLTATFTYSDIEGGFTGTGNIDVTPGFVDPATGNYQLAAGSAAIDSGIVSSSSLLPTVTTDLLGAARPQGAAYDMGAYEFAAQVLPQVDGTCGGSNGGTFTVAPTANLCSTGTASAVTGTGPFAWTCDGTNGGTAASCSAQLQAPPTDIIPPVFSSITVNNRVVTITFSEPVTAVMPATNLGGRDLAFTSVSGSTVTFQIKSCCSTLSAGVTYTLTIPAGAFKDASGNLNPAISVSVTPIPLPAVNGTCGTSNGGIFTVAPTANLCSTGTASAVTGTGPFAWTCDGSNGGTAASCSAQLQVVTPPADVTPPTVLTFATSGTSGSTAAIAVTFSEKVSMTKNLSMVVKIGTFNTVVTGTGSVYNITLMSCCRPLLKPGVVYTLTIPAGSFRDAAGNLNALITTPVSFGTAPIPVNGTCGASNGASFLIAPTANLCSTGTASAVAGIGPFSWTCGGSNGGTAASCSALLTPPAVDTTPPAVVSTVVTKGATVAADVITVTFTEAVTKAKSLDSVMKIGTADSTSTVTGSTVVIKVKSCCLSKVKAGNTYNLTIPAGSFKDAAGNLNAAISIPVKL